MQRHARRAHVQEGGDDIDRAQDRGSPGDVDREDREIHRDARLQRGERRIKHPSDARSELSVAPRCQHRGDAKRHTGHIHPVGQVVQARKGHVRRADHQRHEIVAKTAKQRRNHHEEHHQDAVIGDHHVPQMPVGGAFLATKAAQEAGPFGAHELYAGLHQLHAHIDRKCHRDQADDPRGEQIQDADILVVGGHEPAREKAPLFVVVSGRGSVSHSRLLFCTARPRALTGPGRARIVSLQPF